MLPDMWSEIQIWIYYKGALFLSCEYGRHVHDAYYRKIADKVDNQHVEVAVDFVLNCGTL